MLLPPVEHRCAAYRSERSNRISHMACSNRAGTMLFLRLQLLPVDRTALAGWARRISNFGKCQFRNRHRSLEVATRSRTARYAGASSHPHRPPILCGRSHRRNRSSPSAAPRSAAKVHLGYLQPGARHRATAVERPICRLRSDLIARELSVTAIRRPGPRMRTSRIRRKGRQGPGE